MAVVRAYCEVAYYKEGGISGKVGIGSKAGIEASSGKNAFRLFKMPLLLHRALSIVYSRGVGK